MHTEQQHQDKMKFWKTAVKTEEQNKCIYLRDGERPVETDRQTDRPKAASVAVYGRMLSGSIDGHLTGHWSYTSLLTD